MVQRQLEKVRVAANEWVLFWLSLVLRVSLAWKRRTWRCWPPSASQTGRADFPHPAFTNGEHLLGCKEGMGTSYLVHQRVNLPCPFRIYPVGQSPRPIRFGFFSQGTFLLLDFALLSFWFCPSAFVLSPFPADSRLPPSSGGTAFTALLGYCSTVRPLSVLCSPFRFGLIGSLMSRCLRDNTASSPGVMLNSCGSCRPHTPCCDGLNEFCLRPHSADSTFSHLWPTGSSEVSPLITARSFSSCLSDSASRRTPCPPFRSL